MLLRNLAACCALVILARCAAKMNAKAPSSEEGRDESAGPFVKDGGTVFLADFNDNLTDRVSCENGQVAGGRFAEALFGKSVQFGPTRTPKAISRFSNSSRISVDSGSIEALVRMQGQSADFMHIVDKSWLYGLTVHNGAVALDFGKTWWYSNYSMPLDQWTYLCGSFDGKTIRLFANGVLVDSSAYIPSEGDPSHGLGIGNAFDDGYNLPFVGEIDEIRISKRARTESEVRDAWKRIEKKLANP